MTLALDERTAETVRIYFEQSRQPDIRSFLPQKAQSVEEALGDYYETLLPGAASFGRIVRADGRYVGDVWCYCIDRQEDPNAMLSFCIFDSAKRTRGIATKAVCLFLGEIREKYALASVGAFTYADNAASRRVLEKNGFVCEECFTEDGRESCFYRLSF